MRGWALVAAGLLVVGSLVGCGKRSVDVDIAGPDGRTGPDLPDDWTSRPESGGAEATDASGAAAEVGADVVADVMELEGAALPDAAPEAVGDGAAWDCPAMEPLPECDLSAPVSVSGAAYVFGPPWGTISNATVVILEMPERTTVTDDQGRFTFTDLPPCSDATFELSATGFQTTRTETFRLLGDIVEVAFQVPTVDLVHLLEGLLGTESSPDRCHVATTVSVKEMSLEHYLVPHGVPGATVTLCPHAGLPVYFAYVSDEMILPDTTLLETSVDGGAVFPNVPPGDYVLRAHKEGTSFPEVRVRCEPGAFVNASPPKGLHELGG